jgi:hypothetical protein
MDEGEVLVVEGEAIMISMALQPMLMVNPKPIPTLHLPTAL